MPKTLMPAFVSLTIACAITQQGKAETVDKSGYDLFNPTPAEQMREMSTDRPDATEGAGTVDAGHFQLEMDLYNSSRNKDKAADVKSSETVIGSINVRVGLTNSTELDIMFDPHVEQKVETAGQSDTVSGVGDSMLRLKLNLMGNDGGPIALGLIPFVKIPTAKDELGNGEYEGGLVIPIGLELPNEWELGMMAQFNYLKNDANKRYHTQLDTSITASHDIVGALAGYLELFSSSSTEVDAKWAATVNVGLTYMVTPNFQLDAGANIGATEAADDINPFLGLSSRI